jgi:hypothetical protein
MKIISTIIFSFSLLANICSAQSEVIDDFNDNDLALWSGTTAHFIINTSHQLQLNNNVAGSSYIATTFAPSQVNLEWSVYVRQAFSGSANNYGRIYLLSSQADLTRPTEGYFLQLGEAGTNDAVELFRQSGTALTSVCRAANATIASSFAIRIKVTRDEAGVWKLLIDYTGGTDYAEAATGTDLTYPTGQWMGMVCVYTAGNATRFYYDDIVAGAPKPPPPPPDIADPFDVVINEFFPDPTPSAGLAEEEFVELFNRSSKTFDLDGWKLGDATSFQSMPDVEIKPGEYVVVKNTVSLNNSNDVIKIIDDHGVLIDSLSYTVDWYQDSSKAGGGYTIERLNPEVASMDPTNWYVSQSAVGGTPGLKNSVFGRNPDSKPPKIKGITRVNDSTIVVDVSEEVVIDKKNYVLLGPAGSIAAIDYKPNDTAIEVRLAGLTNGANYSFTIDGLADLAGNVAIKSVFTFTYFIPYPTHPKDIIITEIMADPTPVVQLPEAEYIEILNRSPHPVSLSNWHIEDVTTSAALPPVILMPDSLMLLTSITNASKFRAAIGITSFPSLGNLGDRIVLRNEDDLAIDSIVYNTSWYHNNEKSEGGWSLELIDRSNPCGEDGNWAASDDLDGGTPREPNSVFASKPDLTSPEIVSLFPLSPDTLRISFNEKLGKAAGSYSLPGRAVIGYRDIIYILNEPLSTRVEYSFTVGEVTDCNGNVMKPITVNFSLPEAAEYNDIVINEVLFNPRPTGVDFVEIYNRSSKYLNLKDWQLSGEEITKSNTIIKPSAYLVLTSSIVSVESIYLASGGKPMLEMGLPSLPDDEGTISLSDPTGLVVDRFTYSEDMHSPLIRDPEGVSLERMSPEDSVNWHSASESSGFATPGYRNSSSRPSEDPAEGMVSVSPEVVEQLSFSQIRYRFEQAGLVANVSVVDINGHLIKTIASNETIGAEGSFQWDGDRDAGGRARAGYYLLWFQTFGLDGRVSTYRRRVVVGF